MGKRKSSRKPVVKKREKLDATFDCPVCNDSKSTDYRADKKANVGTIYCRSCFASFTQSINGLSEAIDLYSDWVDSIENGVNPPEINSYKEPHKSYQSKGNASDEGDDLFGEDYEEADDRNNYSHNRLEPSSASRKPNIQDDLFGEEEEEEDYEPAYSTYHKPKNDRVVKQEYDEEDEEDYEQRPINNSRGKRYIQSDDSDEEPAPKSTSRKNKFIYSEEEEEDDEEEEEEEQYF